MEDNNLQLLKESGISKNSIVALAQALSKIESYAPTNYVNDDSPDLDADNLNHAEQGIKRVTDALNLAIDAITALNSDLENLEHQQSETKIQVSGSPDSDPVQGIKDAWPTLPDGLYLLHLTRGTVYCAIVLRVNNGDYGSAYIMSYALDSPIYLTKNQNDYVQH